MLTDVQHINLGLSKIASSRIARLDPATTPIEKFMAVNYPAWKKAEITRRRWVFALIEEYQLTKVATLVNVARPHKYPLPTDCLRPIRTKSTEWIQRGRYIYSAYSTLSISYIADVPESDFDPLFTEVLACKIAFESAEYVTNSSTKKAAALEEYNTAVISAGKANAFVIGPEDIETEDETFGWLNARHGSFY